MSDEYKNLLAGHTPEYTGAEPPRNKLDDGPSLAEMLQRYGPLGSPAMEKRGPWMREHLPASLADFLATSMQYAPLGLRSPSGARTVSRIETVEGMKNSIADQSARQDAFGKAQFDAGRFMRAANGNVDAAQTMAKQMGYGDDVTRMINRISMFHRMRKPEDLPPTPPDFPK
jgi:hypothetical protein